MLTQVGLLALEGAPGERAARAQMLPAPPDPLGDTGVPPRVAGGRPGCYRGAAGPGGGGQGNAVPSSIPGGGGALGRPGAVTWLPPPIRQRWGWGLAARPGRGGSPGCQLSPISPKNLGGVNSVNPGPGPAVLPWGGGQGRSPFQLVMGCPKMCPPLQFRLRGAGQDVGPWGAGRDPEWG